MQEGHTRLEFLRQGHGIVQRLLRIRAKVYGNENVVDRHDAPLSRVNCLNASDTLFLPILVPGRPQAAQGLSPGLHRGAVRAGKDRTTVRYDTLSCEGTGCQLCLSVTETEGCSGSHGRA